MKKCHRNSFTTKKDITLVPIKLLLVLDNKLLSVLYKKVTLCLCITQEAYYGFSQLYGQGASWGENRAA